VNLHDARARLLVGVRELNLAVEPARPQQGRVQNVDAVRRRNDLSQADRGRAAEG